jgi:hypothetical protein
MLIDIGIGKKVFVGVVSHARPDNVAKMRELVGDATWFVGIGESKAYKAAGAVHVVESGPLCRSRNAIIDNAGAKAADYCVELSDDLTKVQIAVSTPKKLAAQDSDFQTVTRMVIEGMLAVGAKLGGAAPTSNPFYSNVDAPIHKSSFIVGDFIVIDTSCGLRFSEEMTLKEDYDYTMQHIYTFGCVARRDDVLMTFLHRKNKGGAVEVRTPQLEQDNIAYLKTRWPDCIVDNPRRPNEILLKLPKYLNQGRASVSK